MGSCYRGHYVEPPELPFADPDPAGRVRNFWAAASCASSAVPISCSLIGGEGENVWFAAGLPLESAFFFPIGPGVFQGAVQSALAPRCRRCDLFILGYFDHNVGRYSVPPEWIGRRACKAPS